MYWEDIPSDAKYEGPFYQNNQRDKNGLRGERDSLSKYLTFEPDTGGFNNNRLAFETALILSVAMGRTLVLPPRQQIPLMVSRQIYRQQYNAIILIISFFIQLMIV